MGTVTIIRVLRISPARSVKEIRQEIMAKAQRYGGVEVLKIRKSPAVNRAKYYFGTPEEIVSDWNANAPTMFNGKKLTGYLFSVPSKYVKEVKMFVNPATGKKEWPSSSHGTEFEIKLEGIKKAKLVRKISASE